MIKAYKILQEKLMEVESEMDADDDEVNEKEREEDVTLEVIDEEIQDYEDKEASLMSIFKREGIKRLSCFATRCS